MKMVVEIPDNYDLSRIQNGSIASKIVLEAVKKGKPLPKGHGRLIDADAKDLQSELWTFTRFTGIDEAPYEDACLVLDKAPTIVEADGGGTDETRS